MPETCRILRQKLLIMGTEDARNM